MPPSAVRVHPAALPRPKIALDTPLYLILEGFRGTAGVWARCYRRTAVFIRSFPDRAEESMRGEPARGPSDVQQLGTSIPARMTCSPGRGQGADQFLG